MLRRLEVLMPYVHEDGCWFLAERPVPGCRFDWVGAFVCKEVRSLAEALGLPELPLAPEDYDLDLRFWWTEAGWKRFGRYLAHILKVNRRTYRVLEACESDVGYIISRDPWQVAVVPGAKGAK